jgi:hypothetical protein
MFPLKFGSQIIEVTKIQGVDFTPAHDENIAGSIRGQCWFSDARWSLLFLGRRGKVFCICDHANRVFALELIDERLTSTGALQVVYTSSAREFIH